MNLGFDYKKPLFSQRPFWLFVLSPLIVAIVLAGVIVWRLELQFDLSEIGLSNFLVYFALPLGIAGLSIPFGAICASQHRTLQTAKQIDAQEEQNNLSNYYKHIEEFHKFIEEKRTESKNELLPQGFSYRTFHRHVFTNLREGSENPGDQFFAHFNSLLKLAQKSLLDADPKCIRATYYIDASDQIKPSIFYSVEALFRHFGIPFDGITSSTSSGYDHPLLPQYASAVIAKVDTLIDLFLLTDEFSPQKLGTLIDDLISFRSQIENSYSYHREDLRKYQEFKSNLDSFKDHIKKDGTLQQEENRWSKHSDESYSAALSYLKNYESKMALFSVHDTRFDSETISRLKHAL